MGKAGSCSETLVWVVYNIWALSVHRGVRGKAIMLSERVVGSTLGLPYMDMRRLT